MPVPDLVSESGTVIEVNYEREYKILADAHRLISNRAQVSKTNPLHKLKEFVDYTDVRAVIEDQNRPVQEMVPKLEKQLVKLNNSLLLLQTHHARLDEKMGTLTNQVRDVGTLHDTISKLERKLNEEVNRQSDVNNHNQTAFQLGRLREADMREEMEKFRKKSIAQDSALDGYRVEIAENRRKFGEEF